MRDWKRQRRNYRCKVCRWVKIVAGNKNWAELDQSIPAAVLCVLII